MDLHEVTEAIEAGEFDGEHGLIVQAIRDRVKEGGSRFYWKMQIDGLVITEEDLTLGELHAIQKATGKNWTEVNPAEDAVMCAAVLIACFSARRELNQEKAWETVKKFKAAELIAAVSEYEVVSPPKDGTPSTS